MAADPIRSYQRARRELDEATTRAEDIVRGVTYVATLLDRWRSVEFIHPKFEGPRDTTMPIEADDWPHVDDLVNALSKWHRAAKRLSNAWSRIPEEERIGLQPPPAHVSEAARHLRR